MNSRKPKRHQSLLKAKRIFRFFRPYWKSWMILFLVSLILSAFGLINPLIVKFLIDDVLIAKNYELLKLLMFFFVGITLFATAISVFYNYFYRKLALYILYDVRNKLFEHLEELDLDFFKKKRLGDILTRLGSDIGGIEKFISLIFNRLVRSIFTLILILIISLILNWKMTLMVMLVVPLYVISQRYYAGKLHGLYRLLKRQSAALMSFLEEKLSAIALVKLFGREEYELEREKHKMKRLIDTSLKVTLISTFAGTIIGLLTFAALLFVLWYGGYQVIVGAMSLGALIAIYSYLGGFFSPVEAIVGLYTAIQDPLASANRVFQILDTKPKIEEKKGARRMPKIKGEIVFENVSFTYLPRRSEAKAGLPRPLSPTPSPLGRGGGPTRVGPGERGDDKMILKNVNFRISPGEIIGIVGSSGTGKTTIANLITRFYDPGEGRVLIDGLDIRDVNIQSLRKQIGLVRQNTILFNASVKENLTYGCESSVAASVIVSAVKEARIEGVIEALPKKYKNVLGEKGMTLSGGERQRLSIARTILKNPQIVILDEATSFIDFETELQVMQNLRRIFAGKTMFIIAHRLSSLEDVDRIMVLKDKTILEIGSFKELLDKKGEFFRLYNYQIGGFSRFEEKLKNELRRSLPAEALAKEGLSASPLGRGDYQPLSAIGVSIKNIDELIEAKGERETVKLLDRILTEISTFLPSPYFSAQDQDQRELFYIILPALSEVEGPETPLSSPSPLPLPEGEMSEGQRGREGRGGARRAGERGRTTANQIAASLTSHLLKKFPEIKLEAKTTLATPGLRDAAKLLKAVS